MDAIIALVHSDEADGNFLFVSARNEEELVKKGQGIVGKFLSGRIPALETYLADARKAGENERLVNFLSEKLQGNQSAIPSGFSAKPTNFYCDYTDS